MTIYKYDTEAEKPKAQSAKLKGKFYSRGFDGNYRFICDEDEQGVDVAAITSWFTSVAKQIVFTICLRPPGVFEKEE